jgi:hypothetical protein
MKLLFCTEDYLPGAVGGLAVGCGLYQRENDAGLNGPLFDPAG